MKTIQIKAYQFFEMLKNNGVSMWDLFRNMIDGDEKQLLFLDKDEKIIAEYILPKTVEELDDDLETFKKDNQFESEFELILRFFLTDDTEIHR